MLFRLVQKDQKHRDFRRSYKSRGRGRYNAGSTAAGTGVVGIRA